MSTKKRELLQYRDLVSRVRIDHDAYATILDELVAAYDAIGQTATPVCLLITGESRTGKSSVVRELLETYLPTRVEDKLIRTVVYAVAPAKATVKSLLEALLKGLGDPHWSRGTESSLTQRLYTLLDAVQCKMIILDEFQHLCDKGQKKKLDQLADWLKVLLETHQCGLVAVGLPEAASVIHTHVQLIGRFDDELRMPLFDWRDRASAAQFRGILRQFQQELKPFELPQLDSPVMAIRMYLASAGRIGLIAKLLDRAVRNAVRAGRWDIGLDALAVAYDRAIWSARLFPVKGGPFRAALDLLVPSEVQQQVLAHAALEEVADHSAAVTVHGSEAVASTAAPAGDRAVKAKAGARTAHQKAAPRKTPKARQRGKRGASRVQRELGRAF